MCTCCYRDRHAIWYSLLSICYVSWRCSFEESTMIYNVLGITMVAELHSCQYGCACTLRIYKVNKFTFSAHVSLMSLLNNIRYTNWTNYTLQYKFIEQKNYWAWFSSKKITLYHIYIYFTVYVIQWTQVYCVHIYGK